MGYCRKNPNRWGRGGVEDILFWTPPGILHFFTLPLEIPNKTKLNPWIFHKIVLDSLAIPTPKTKPLEIPHYFFLVTLGNSTLFLIQKGDAHKYVWLASRNQSNFCFKVRVRWSAPIKTEKKLKGRFISIRHLLVIETCIFLTWDNFKGKPNLALLWQWLAAWKPLKSGSHVSWRGLCVFFRICYSIYLKLVVFPEHFICYATEMDLKINRLNFSINLQINFLKRNFIVLNWKQFSRFLFSNRFLEVIVLST